MRLYKILNKNENLNFIAKLLNILHGSNGLLTCIMTYTYQSFLLGYDLFHDNIRKELLLIVDEKLNHYKLIHKTLYNLGIIPYVIKSDKTKHFDYTINYECNIYKFLLNDIYLESILIDNLETFYIESNNIELKNILKNMLAAYKKFLNNLKKITIKFLI